MTFKQFETLWLSSVLRRIFVLVVKKPRKSSEKLAKKARRWVVERTHSWMNRFRRILIRWEKKPENYIAMLHFACALIAFRAAGLFG